MTPIDRIASAPIALRDQHVDLTELRNDLVRLCFFWGIPSSSIWLESLLQEDHFSGAGQRVFLGKDSATVVRLGQRHEWGVPDPVAARAWLQVSFAANRQALVVDLPGFCGERLAHFPCLSLEGDGALEAER